MLSCRFLKIREEAKLPKKANEKAVGFDIFPIEAFGIDSREVKLVSTGLVALPPIGYYFELVLRSSTPIRYPGLVLANHIGIIDPNYVGKDDEIKIALCNLSAKTHYITTEKPIAQLILRDFYHSEAKEITLEEHEKLFGDSFRGGFGSTDSPKEG